MFGGRAGAGVGARGPRARARRRASRSVAPQVVLPSCCREAGRACAPPSPETNRPPSASHAGGSAPPAGGVGRLCGGCGLISSPNGQPLLLTNARLFTSTAHDGTRGSSGRMVGSLGPAAGAGAAAGGGRARECARGTARAAAARARAARPCVPARRPPGVLLFKSDCWPHARSHSRCTIGCCWASLPPRTRSNGALNKLCRRLVL